jgi:UDP-N-acetylmuramate dehydrogenase
MNWYAGLEHIVRETEPLAPYTWFRLGGAARYFAEPTNVDELAQLIRRASESKMVVRVLGGGSQVLVSDRGVDGLVVHLAAPAFCYITTDGDTVTAGGGAKLGHVISTAVRDGLGGLESLIGIPGTVGGALRGNAESNGASIGQWTEQVTLLAKEGSIKTRGREHLHFSYGQSNLDEPVILEARLRLERGDSQELTRRMQKLWILKRGHQPSPEVNCGRIFADAQGMNAAELIAQAGLRSQRVGQAEVSEVNCNFIVANPGATTKDVVDLIALIRQQVHHELGIELEQELQIW